MNDKIFISYECRECLAQWVRACGVSLGDPEGREFIRGLYFIVDEELRDALARARATYLSELFQANSN